MNYLFLLGAIVAEVVATSALAASDRFTRLGPSLIVVVGYATAFYLLSWVLRTIPVGVAYAIWSGLGIVLVSIVGVLYFKQRLDFAGLLGIGLIVSGVVVLQLFSAAGHR